MKRLFGYFALLAMLPYLLLGQAAFGAGYVLTNGPIWGADGTVSAPQFTFASDDNTGIYLRNPNQLAFAADGTEAGYVDSSGMVLPDNLQVGGVVKLANGTVANPALQFASDTASGLYWIGVSNIGIGVNGAKVLDIGTTGLTVSGIAVVGGGPIAATLGQLRIAQTDNTVAGGILFNSTVAAENAGIFHDGGTLGLIIRESGVNIAGFTAELSVFGSSTIQHQAQVRSLNNSTSLLKIWGYGSAGSYLQFTEEAVKDWFVGIDNGSTALRIRPDSLATAYVAQFSPTSTSFDTPVNVQAGTTTSSTLTVGGNSSLATKIDIGVAGSYDNQINFLEGGAVYFQLLHEGSAGGAPNNLFKIRTASGAGTIDTTAITIEQSGAVTAGPSTATGTTLINQGYTQLGEAVDGGGTTPAFAVKSFTGTTDADSQTNVAHGLTAARIKHVSCRLFDSGTGQYYETFSGTATIAWDGSNITISSIGVASQSQNYYCYAWYEAS